MLDHIELMTLKECQAFLPHGVTYQKAATASAWNDPGMRLVRKNMTDLLHTVGHFGTVKSFYINGVDSPFVVDTERNVIMLKEGV